MPTSEYLVRISASESAVQVDDPHELRRIIYAIETARWRDQENATRLAWLVGIVATCVGLIVGYGVALFSR